MPTNFEILIQAKADMTGANQAKAALQGVDQAAQQADKSLAKSGDSAGLFGQKLDGIGRRDISRAMSGMFLGIDAALNAMGAATDKETKKLLDMAKAAEGVGVAFAFGGPVGGALAALGLAVGTAVGYLQEQHDALANVIAVSDPYIASINAMRDANRQLFSKEQLAQFDAIEKKIADLKATAAGGLTARDYLGAAVQGMFGGLAGQVQALAQAEQQAALYAQAYEGSLVAMAAATVQFRNEINVTVEAEGIWLAQNNNIAASMRQVTAETDAAAKAMAAFNEMLGQAYIQQVANPLAQQFVTELNSIPRTQGQIDAKKYHDLGVEMGKHVGTGLVDQVQNAIRGMVEKALAPTAVTAEDMAAAAAGTYIDKWDEFARRADAVAKGTDPSKYGAAFADQLAKLGMTAEQAAAGFRDFSLFADPKNLALVDWGPVVADVQHQIDMLIGKANLAKEAFDQVWAALDPGKKAQLAGALGVDPTDANNAQKVFDAMSGGEAQQSVKTTSEIAANIQTITGIHTAIIDVQKSGSFDANLQEILDDLAKIPNGYDVTVSINYVNGGGPGAPTGGAEVPVPTGPGVTAQHGLSMVVPPGYDENFPILASSGERVFIIPPNMTDPQLAAWLRENSSFFQSAYNANAGTAGGGGGGGGGPTTINGGTINVRGPVTIVLDAASLVNVIDKRTNRAMDNTMQSVRGYQAHGA